MDAIDSAETSLADLLVRVERGESITILRNGKPVAILMPPDGTAALPGTPEARAAATDLRAAAQTPAVAPFTGEELKAMRDEGRR